MKKTIRVLWALIAVLTVQVCFISCSDDEPENKEGQQTEEWRKDLRVLTMRLTHHPTLFGGGGSFDMTYRFFAAMQIVDQNGNDLMSITNPNNVIDSDFYFEYQGKKYHLGDTNFPVAGLSKKVGIFGNMDLVSDILAPFTLEWQEIAEMKEPVDITYDFVWPSRNIRHTIRAYVEPNTAFKKQYDAFMADTTAADVALEVYKFGMWVDGVSYPPVSRGFWFKLKVDINS